RPLPPRPRCHRPRMLLGNNRCNGMSTLAAQLKRLRLQAGAEPAARPAAASPVAHGRVAIPAFARASDTVPPVADPALRRLLLDAPARRPPPAPRPTTATAMPQRTLPPSRTPASPCPIPDRRLPGTELAPGLHYLERHPGLTLPAGAGPELPLP